ncbi:MAG: 5'/3'-nucleotidase SurE [Gammaproteobacteria bacterium]|nr:5'/3'-nucleotidase SurE [Gammaproteobacteria bacterium]
MKILLSNDDGYRAAGLTALAAALAARFEITVVAPEDNCSGASNSLSLNRRLQVVEQMGGDGDGDGDAGGDKHRGRRWPLYRVRGTPADSVHLAVNGMLDFKPDMVVAGVNHGANLGDDVLYSGTVAAAIEGRFLGLPALAVSLAGADADAPAERFAAAAEVVIRILEQLRARPLPQDTILNINVPDLRFAQLRGFRATRLGARHPAMPIIEAAEAADTVAAPNAPATTAAASTHTVAAAATTPAATKTPARDFRIGAPGHGADVGPGTDFHAVAAGAVSVTPLQIDMTRHPAVGGLADWLRGLAS